MKLDGKILGTTVDFAPAVRDSVLAGGFTALVALAALQRWEAFVLGYLGGAFLGVALHMLPPEPVPGDSRKGRVTVRTITGVIAGAGTAPTIAWLIGDTTDPAELAMAGALGTVAGFVWYFGWGIWETRS